MAAEVLSAAGVQVDLCDAMASVGRKFLLAGKGGLNLTHSEAFEPFVSRYAERAAQVESLLRVWDGPALRAWAEGLGVSTFVGSSGRVFPTDMKAAPLLRAWLARLRSSGVRFYMRTRWLGWGADGEALLRLADGTEVQCRPTATLLALGGASWPQLGSDGAWVPLVQAAGLGVVPLRAANCGFDIGPTAAHAESPGWSPRFLDAFAGQPVKPVVLRLAGRKRGQGEAPRQFERQGEFVITATGVEGSLVYAASALLREEIAEFGEARIELDLLPSHSPERVWAEVSHPRGSRSLSSHLKGRLGIEGLKAGLLHELLTRDEMLDPALLTSRLKGLPLRLRAARPVAEAISTAGGVRFEDLDEGLMVCSRPGLFCAGEMLDWEAPTGGYLLTASMASGRVAGEAAARWVSSWASAGPG